MKKCDSAEMMRGLRTPTLRAGFGKNRLIPEEHILKGVYPRSMDITLRSGIVMQQSGHSVDETLRKLLELLETRSIKVFAVIDHSGEAEKVGLHMPNTKLVLFGSPRTGTPVMLAAPSAALDLPLKILVSEDASGSVWLSYNSPAYVAARHGFTIETTKFIGLIEALAKEAAD